MTAKKRWTIVASGDHALSEVAAHVREAGFTVEQVLSEIGCITGAANDEVASKLRSLPGVAAVEPELGIDVGPPGASTTW